MEKFRFGWRRRRMYGVTPTLYIGTLPKRKSVAIYTVDGGKTRVHGYFRTVEDAEKVYDLLEELINVGIRET